MAKSLQEMQVEVHDWCVTKGWIPNELTFGDRIALMHSELSEALEAYRIHRMESFTTKNGKPDDVQSELADLFIRLLDNCAALGIDLEAEYERKMAYNQKRPWRHGGKAM